MDEIIKKLKEMPKHSAVSFLTDTDNYFNTVDICAKFMTENNFNGIYVTSTRPASIIEKRLAEKGIISKNIHFIDCISYMVGGSAQAERTSYLESPTMLENIMIKIDTLIKKLKGEKCVVIDAVNTFTIYNEERLLSEFIHILVNSLRVKEIFTILITVEEQTPKELQAMIELVCDDKIILKKSQ